MTVARIKAAALQAFAKKGYEGAKLSEIAAAVGIKTPSLYAHFRSKEDLFLSVAADVIHQHVAQTQELLTKISGEPVEQQLWRILHDASSYYLYSEDHMTFFKRAILFPPAALETQIRERFLASESQLSAILTLIFQQGMAQGVIREHKVEDLLASYYCLLDGLFIQNFYYGPELRSDRLQSVWRIFWTGITTQ